MFPQLTATDFVAQWFTDSSVTFVLPTDRQVLRHQGPMVHIDSKTIDLRVTPDHRCLLRWRSDGRLEVRPASDYIPDRQQIQAGIYSAGPGIPVTDDQLRLIVAMQADGSWINSKAPSAAWVFSKTRKIERMRELLTRVGASFTESHYNKLAKNRPLPITRFGLHVGPVADLLFMVLDKQKLWGVWLLQMSRHQIDVFIKEVLLWDGCSAQTSESLAAANSGSLRYSSNVGDNADWVQIMFTLSGKRASLARRDGGNYKIVLGNNRDHTSTPIVKPIPSAPVDETVYCVTVPSSFVIVRRNGKVSVTGNCYGAAKGGKEETLFKSIASVENADGSLVYASLTLAEVRNRRAAWLGANPEIEAQWAMTLAKWRQDGFLIEPIHGHRLDFLDGENDQVENEVIAFEAQAACAAIVHDANLELVAPSGGMDASNDAPLRYEFAGPNTGQVNQSHDSLVFEVPEGDAERLAKIIKIHMTRRYPCYDVDFTAKPKIGKTWAKV